MANRMCGTARGAAARLLPVVAAALVVVGAQDAQGCRPGHELRVSGNLNVSECRPCQPGQYGLGGTSGCEDCPVGTYSDRTGASVCHCKENYYFDTVAASAFPVHRWPTLGCTDCLSVLPIEEARVSLECPGGREPALPGHEPSRFVPLGPVIALSGWYLEAHACFVDGVGPRILNKTCFTRHACADDHCFGLTDFVRKEMMDMPEASAGLGNRTEWCMRMHQVALVEGVSLEDLRLPPENPTDTATNDPKKTWFFHEESSCKEHYVKAISTARSTRGTGVQNVCYPGHDASSKSCASCTEGLKKGDDALCHSCKNESLWLLFRGDIISVVAYQVPLTLFRKSGRPQALKSAMFASFMFFMQTVTLLGKDSGYFLGPGFVEQEGKQIYIDTVDAVSRFLSSAMVASATPIAENSTVAAVSVCPTAVDRHQVFFKNAVLRSLLLLAGCFIWNNVIYWLFVNLRLHYYGQWLLKTLSGGRLCADNHFEWNTEVKVMWQQKLYEGETPGLCQYLKGLIIKDKTRRKRYEPVYDKVAYGPSAILLDFHTCGTLFNDLKAMESAKEKVAQVQARAHFKLHDIDGDNFIQEQEMHNLLLQLGERPRPADVTEIMQKYGDPETGAISENQFTAFWIARRKIAREKANLVTHSSCARLCSPWRWCTHDLSEFRPMGGVRAECVVLSQEVDVAMQIIQQAPERRCCKEKPPLHEWFEKGEDSLAKFQQAIADISTNGEADRVRVNRVLPYSQREVLVNFDVLPQGYSHDSRIFEPERIKRTKLQKLAVRMSANNGCCRCCSRTTSMQRLHVKDGLEIRKRLEAVFADVVKFGDGTERLEARELDLENLIDLKDAVPQARFLRAVMMLCTTVLYYPVIQETIPMLHCTAYPTGRWWNVGGGPNRLGIWEKGRLQDSSVAEDARYLESDRSMICDGFNHVMTQSVAYLVLAFCVFCPLVAFKFVKSSKHAAMLLAAADNHSKDCKEAVVFRRSQEKKGCLRQIFLKAHYPPTHSDKLLFEARILRDPFSGLYAMCEQRAYYWFVVDLLRKAAVTVVFIFGKNFDWQFVMLCMFVFFALIQDVAQPYRGRAENLFSFMTLLFMVVLIHTSTTVSNDSMLPLFIAMGIMGSTLILFIIATGFQKIADAEEAAAADRTTRKAQDLWGRVGKHVLRLDPSKSDEASLKRAFRVFDNVDPNGVGRRMRKSISKSTASALPDSRRHTLLHNETDARGDGAITRWELMAVRDNDRRLSGYRVEGLEEPGSPATAVVPCFNASEEEIDEMILQCDSDGKANVTYAEFVAVIFNSWERRNQTDMLCSWLFKEFRRADARHIVRVREPCCRCCAGHDKHGMHKRYLDRQDSHAFVLKENDLSLDVGSFMGMLEAISMREKVDDGKAPGFTVDMDKKIVIGMQYADEWQQAKQARAAARASGEQENVLSDSDSTNSSDSEVSDDPVWIDTQEGSSGNVLKL